MGGNFGSQLPMSQDQFLTRFLNLPVRESLYPCKSLVKFHPPSTKAELWMEFPYVQFTDGTSVDTYEVALVDYPLFSWGKPCLLGKKSAIQQAYHADARGLGMRH
jgi:hypothetical protein